MPIAVRAAGLNFADTMARVGLYPATPKTPCVLGYEVAGEVESIGEGVNGLALHVINDTPAELAGTLRVALYRHGETNVGQAERAITLAPRGGATLSADAMFEGFRDLTWSYRFGPPGHDLIVATLTRAEEPRPLARVDARPARAPGA